MSGRTISRVIGIKCRNNYVSIVYASPLCPECVKVHHDLKSWVGLFEPIFNGEKTHELRVLDRDYRVGDVCRLREFEPTTKFYTGREAFVRITYITSAKHEACAFSPFALHPGMGVLSICKL